jgi:polysaccharide biosynthesis protein PslG
MLRALQTRTACTDVRSPTSGWLRTSWWSFAVIATLVATFAFPSASDAAQKGLSVDLTWASSPSEQSATEPLIAESGSKWVRMTLNWSDAEPNPGEYNPWWIAQYDNAVTLAQQAGEKIIFVVGASPSWASGSSNTETPPRNPADYATFIHYVASRYAGRVSAWEIWNEENTARFWSTGPSAAQYVALLKAAYPAVKSADPSAAVLFGGTSLNDYKFISEAYAAGAKGNFDVMAVHPYSCRAPGTVVRDGNGNVTPDSFLGYRGVHNVMLANGDEKPIWFTEMGWSSSTGGSCSFGQATQAAYLTEAYKLADQDPYVQVACWYNLRNDYWSHDENSVEAQYGLLNTDFSPKPAYAAFKAYIPGSGGTGSSSKAGSSSGSPGSTEGTNLGTNRGSNRVSTGATTKHIRRHGTRTLVSTSTTTSGARAASVSSVRRRSRAHVVKGVVLGASSGQVIVRLERYNRATRRWRRVSVVRVGLGRRGGFWLKIAGHSRARRMRVRVKFPGTATAAPSVSHYVTFTA